MAQDHHWLYRTLRYFLTYDAENINIQTDRRRIGLPAGLSPFNEISKTCTLALSRAHTTVKDAVVAKLLLLNERRAKRPSMQSMAVLRLTVTPTPTQTLT